MILRCPECGKDEYGSNEYLRSTHCYLCWKPIAMCWCGMYRVCIDCQKKKKNNDILKRIEEALDKVLPNPVTTTSTKGEAMRSKLISIEKANKMLPLVSRIATDISEQWSTIVQKRTFLEQVEREELPVESKGKMVQELKDELNNLIDKINRHIKEIEQLGCYVEEFRQGVINFPSLYDGRKIFLCWAPTSGQEEITYWHEIDEAWNHRKPIHETGAFYRTEIIKQEAQ